MWSDLRHRFLLPLSFLSDVRRRSSLFPWSWPPPPQPLFRPPSLAVLLPHFSLPYRNADVHHTPHTLLLLLVPPFSASRMSGWLRKRGTGSFHAQGKHGFEALSGAGEKSGSFRLFVHILLAVGTDGKKRKVEPCPGLT